MRRGRDGAPRRLGGAAPPLHSGEADAARKIVNMASVFTGAGARASACREAFRARA